MQSGEITVTGKGEVLIPLHKFPSEVHVAFKDELEVVPCNPHHVDMLEYDVHKSHTHHGGFSLQIRWRVSGLREVVWRALY